MCLTVEKYPRYVWFQIFIIRFFFRIYTCFLTEVPLQNDVLNWHYNFNSFRSKFTIQGYTFFSFSLYLFSMAFKQCIVNSILAFTSCKYISAFFTKQHNKIKKGVSLGRNYIWKKMKLKFGFKTKIGNKKKTVINVVRRTCYI